MPHPSQFHTVDQIKAMSVKIEVLMCVAAGLAYPVFEDLLQKCVDKTLNSGLDISQGSGSH